MRRFVPQIVALLFIAGLLVLVIGGPWWGYMVAVLLGFLIAPFAVAYPSNAANRFVWGAFGVFLLTLGVSALVLEGSTLIAARAAAFLFAFGPGIITCAA